MGTSFNTVVNVRKFSYVQGGYYQRKCVLVKEIFC